MAAPEGPGPELTPGLFASLRSFWSVLVAILYTRLDLVTAELEDSAIYGLKFLLAGLVSMLCFFGAFFFAMYFLIAMFWDTEYRLYMIGGIFFFYFGAGAVLFIIARNLIVSRPRFLSQTLAELKRDVEGLKKSMAPGKEEPKP